ncbi:KAP family P-loop NTPase fold protein [Mycolicibacterium austroafricanum]|uniref:KAP family P-loop NTPase fold protein n=1 Tax=Mycolicibacterium austroafricanum TaxID=39687 RepID=UPI000685B1EE|nr:P-loop NTPase fold protein [Mycolicibacterium austroafricanum]
MPLRDDNPSPVDLLGFEDVVDVVEEIVLRRDLDPITVGVNAPWGGGKTTVLHLLQQRLDTREDVLCLLISPWEYDNKTDPTTALIDEVLAGLEKALKEPQSRFDKIKEGLHKLRRRVSFAKAMKLAASSALTATLPGVGGLIDLFDENAEEKEEPSDPTLQGFRTQFQDLMADPEMAPLDRVVVLVDDLDRSLPDTVVEALEAIKLFLSVNGMAFVIAADEDNVANAIGRRLATTGQPITARNYMEKIIQVPVRVPALSREQTEEYLALLMLTDHDQLTELIERIKDTRPAGGRQLAERFGDALPDDRREQIALAQQLTPLLHRQTTGNPRRIKRFLNAYWLRTSFAAARRIKLEPEALAKLMLAELHYPELFGQLLGWLAAGNVAEKVAEIESGEGEHSQGVREWGQLAPDLSGEDLSQYLLLAASLRGEPIEAAALPPELRAIASQLSASSATTRRTATREAAKLDESKRVVIAGFLATSLRQQRSPDSQKALAESISALADSPAIAATAAEELRRMSHGSLTAGVPLALLAQNQPTELAELVREWTASPDAPDLVRNAGQEALKQ